MNPSSPPDKGRLDYDLHTTDEQLPDCGVACASAVTVGRENHYRVQPGRHAMR